MSFMMSELDAPTARSATGSALQRAYAKPTLPLRATSTFLEGMEDSNDATDEAGSEAKAPQGSRTGVGSRWRVFVASGRRIRSNRTGSGCTVVEHRTRSRNHAQ
jgi:hypothetical protein